MKVKCIGNSGKDVSQKLIDLRLAIRTTDYGLSLGSIYPVYGIIMWKTCLHYLLPMPGSPKGDPFWYPAELFQVEENGFPNSWYFQYFGEDTSSGINAVWGFEELATDINFASDLWLSKTDAIKIYHRRIKEIDSEPKKLH